MAKTTIWFGLILILLGVSTYFLGPADHRSLTAFIPSVVGGCLMLAGTIAQNPSMRKHAMHAAALVGLIGFVGALVRVIGAVVKSSTVPVNGLALFAQSTMAILCLSFLVLCINSFTAARRARVTSAAGQE